VELELWPDSDAFFRSLETGQPQPMLRQNAPFMNYTVWSGRLTDPSLRDLDTRSMEEIGSGVIGAGQTVDLEHACLVGGGGAGDETSSACPAGTPTTLTMAFPDLVRYSVLQVTKDVGVPIVLAAAILLLMGLLPALYTSRRKLWVRAEPDRDGVRLQIGGFALQRKPQFEEEFAKVVAAIADATGSSDASAREMVEAR
jgi:cytochrome c biogenesis protein ResB